jgi:hypothetical protein
MARGAIEARYDRHAEFYDRLFAANIRPTDSAEADLTQLLGPPASDSVVREVARVLAPGGRFAYVGTHPCFV